MRIDTWPNAKAKHVNRMHRFYNPWWLVDVANLAVVIHLIGTWQARDLLTAADLLVILHHAQVETQCWSSAGCTCRHDALAPYLSAYPVHFKHGFTAISVMVCHHKASLPGSSPALA